MWPCSWHLQGICMYCTVIQYQWRRNRIRPRSTGGLGRIVVKKIKMFFFHNYSCYFNIYWHFYTLKSFEMFFSSIKQDVPDLPQYLNQVTSIDPYNKCKKYKTKQTSPFRWKLPFLIVNAKKILQREDNSSSVFFVREDNSHSKCFSELLYLYQRATQWVVSSHCLYMCSSLTYKGLDISDTGCTPIYPKKLLVVWG